MIDHQNMQFKPNTTVAAVVHCQGKFLLVEELEQGKTVFNQPAGHLEANENLISACQRELEEETGLRLSPSHLCGIYYFHRPELSLYFLRFCFVIEATKQYICQPQDDDIITTHWFTVDEIKQRRSQLRSPMVLDCINDYLSGVNIPLSSIKTNL
jgi:phosphatase NudJ